MSSFRRPKSLSFHVAADSGAERAMARGAGDKPKKKEKKEKKERVLCEQCGERASARVRLASGTVRALCTACLAVVQQQQEMTAQAPQTQPQHSLPQQSLSHARDQAQVQVQCRRLEPCIAPRFFLTSC